MLDEFSLKIFKFLWDNAEEEHSISEVSKNSKVSYGKTWKILKEFKRQELVTLAVKKAYLYKLNANSEVCFKTWELWNSLRKQELSNTPGYEQYYEIMNYLAGKIKNKFIVLFGSVARKEASKNSDLDVLIVADKKIGVSDLESDILVRYFTEARMTIVTEKELQKQLEKNKEVYKNIWVDGIVWSGAAEYFTIMKKRMILQ
jgi:predicted nucleotidyltransferase